MVAALDPAPHHRGVGEVDDHGSPPGRKTRATSGLSGCTEIGTELNALSSSGLANLNDDDYLDLFIPIGADDEIGVQVWTGTADGLVYGADVLLTPEFKNHYVATDFDGDGFDELLTSRAADGQEILSIHSIDLNSQASHLDRSLRIAFDLGLQDVATGDIDGDGVPDVALASYRSLSRVVLTQLDISSTPKLTDARTSHLAGTFQARGVTLADLDGDADGNGEGYEEIVLLIMERSGTVNTEGALWIFRHDGAASFTQIARDPVPFNNGSDRIIIEAANIDADDYADVIVADDDGLRIYLSSPDRPPPAL